jgi:hypothetical protein
MVHTIMFTMNIDIISKALTILLGMSFMVPHFHFRFINSAHKLCCYYQQRHPTKTETYKIFTRV